MNSPNLTLRESKRRATKAAIEEHATRLVLDRGFDGVTVEDICQAAEISKRTFFNYVDSKETAVLGPLPTPLSEDEVHAFARDVHTPLLASIVDLIVDGFIEGYGYTCPEVRKRRKQILTQRPQLGVARMSQLIEAHKSYKQALGVYFNAHPDQRQLDALSVEAEADTWMSLARTCIELGFHRWAEDDDASDNSLRRSCHFALAHLHTLITNEHQGDAH